MRKFFFTIMFLAGIIMVSCSSDSAPADNDVPDVDIGQSSGCGYKNLGVPAKVGDSIFLCLPSTVCTPAVCPPEVGDCVDNKCVYKGEYKGLATVPEAVATYYCDIPTGGCNGVTQIEKVEVTAQKIADDTKYKAAKLPLCYSLAAGDSSECVGIVASPPMMTGNSQDAKDSAGKFVREWGLGLTEASGLCYEIEGPTGAKALLALTDRCGGYCTCNGSGVQECGPCVNAADLKPNCPCIGTVPGLYTECCGDNCGLPVEQECDWCSSNNHPHFDLDTGAFNHVCPGSSGIMGSCKLRSAKYVKCMDAMDWPPGGGPASCGEESFDCKGTSPDPVNQPLVPGTQCCCNWGMKPQPDKSCGSGQPSDSDIIVPDSATNPDEDSAITICNSGSFDCSGVSPDPVNQPLVPGTQCCCDWGLKPQSDKSCL